MLQISSLELLEGTIYIICGIFAIVLLSLSFYAYVQSRVKRILYASFAFVFFVIYLFFEGLENFFPIFDSSYADVIASVITAAVLALFFLTIVKK
ncbi:MAG TPA: hypothetical protein VFC05_08125 [Nitrososphaeraceae archaeon]|nr:hypothetical protein [Nitrososphaeraceae archaeon]